MDIISYKGYEGTAELDMERCVCRGKILFIGDLVTYEAAHPAGLKEEFEAAVDDYIETCQVLGREPQKPCKGQFNVRVPPALHKEATLLGMKEGSSLNDVVVKALDAYLSSGTKINHNHNLTITLRNPNQTFQTLSASGREPNTNEWKNANVH